MDTDAVLTLLQDTAEEVITPRFRALEDGEITSKTHPGDWVTIADREAEVLITAALRAAYPDALVLGEEAYAEDASLLEQFRAADHAFTVDPVDGTRNFVHGSPDHAVMAAEVRDGETVRAWIWQPQHRTAFVAERGAGLWCNGDRVPDLRAPSTDPRDWDVRTSTRTMIGSMLGETGPLTLTWVCSGVDYPKVATGACDAIVYSGTMPWDHAPGSLMVTEVGGHVGTTDGEPYTPRCRPRGIVVAQGREVYETLRRHL
ncbi:fructose-1,6-bisphosphatase/inositol monophosphatase family enzyme [Ornithinimicrobium humiphilum]|uniref:Fructose-1,6-bisphosphatase/inositol monophosphatase family enzyme n=1 Tax=Ornithinimicrobium humiphilum TaxID=125288 RepID=A0A543KND9_9MICO|nr:inositol monophosphatase [Ornithinimicrobium humiphilum]TQM96595.1 fructose-1,6-bisphosphatase/inositol monophosphatase family enzyme [Ornithinimicrobium humiphilum]